MTAMALLDVRDLTAHYGTSQALFGMTFAVEPGQCITLLFDRGVQFVQSPLTGATDFLGTSYSSYRLLVIPLSLAVIGLLGWMLNGSRLGLVTRAVIMNEDLARALPRQRLRHLAARRVAGTQEQDLLLRLVVTWFQVSIFRFQDPEPCCSECNGRDGSPET